MGNFREELETRLLGSKFRLINDKIYNNKKISPKDMQEYYKYYDHQVKKWPQNPLDKIIQKIEDNHKTQIIADLGCGSGKIGKLFENVHSFDVFPSDKHVVKADMTAIPMEDKQVDVAVCCLSLMMEYASKAIKEISRILKINGVFYLAEVKSRIASVNGLCKQLEAFGFSIINCDTSNTHFVLIELKKEKDFDKKKLPKIILKPCHYKKR